MKIAIYSGEIPSSEFIERLILGMTERNNKVFLFGQIRKKVVYNKNVKVIGYSTKWQKIFQYLKYNLLLSLFRFKIKKKLDKLLIERAGDKRELIKLKVKYYPVLYWMPDIFHLQWAKSINDWQWVQSFNIKLILSLRGSHINYSPVTDKSIKEMYELHFPHTNRFHAVSHAIKKRAERYGATSDKVDVIYSGLDLEKISFTTKKTHTNVIKLISVGRSHWVKGYTYALRAMTILKAHQIPFEYTIIGGMDEELNYTKKAFGLNDKEVSFSGAVSFKEVCIKMQNADLLLLTSVEEGIANVVLEAMALGLPVLTTACGGMEEVVEDGISGWVVPIRDPEALAKKIMEIRNLSSEDVDRVKLNARKKIEAQHDLEKMIDQMENMYIQTNNAN